MIGGCFDYEYTQALNRVDIYDIKARKWKGAPSLQMARWNSSSCALPGKIFVFCGQNNS